MARRASGVALRRLGVAADAAQNLGEVLGRVGDADHAVGVAAGAAVLGLAARGEVASEQQRDAARLDGLGVERGASDGVEAALVGHAVLGPKALAEPDDLGHAGAALLRIDARGEPFVALGLVECAADTDAEVEAPAGEHVYRGRGLR